MNMTGCLPSRSSSFSPWIVVEVNTHGHILIQGPLEYAIETYTVLGWVEVFMGQWLRSISRDEDGPEP